MEAFLNGKVALITGGSTGMGFAIAQRIAEAGGKVVIASRNPQTGQAAEQRLRNAGHDAHFIAFDMMDEASVQAMVEAAAARHGRLDILVNNAGPNGSAFGLGLVHELSSEGFDEAMKVGIYGLFWSCKYALPHLVKAGESSVINLSAGVALRAAAKMTGYSLVKAALEALTRQIANDYARQGVRCNSLLLGTMRAEDGDISTLPAEFDSATLDKTTAGTTMVGHVGTYADAANAALFLLSPASRFITGVGLPVDGGALGKMGYPDYTETMDHH